MHPSLVTPWPTAVRSADLMRGALVRCGPGTRPVGWPEMPRTRLASLSPWLDGGRRTATHRTAAWVWGAARDPGTPLRVCTPPGARRPALQQPGLVRVGEYALASNEISAFDALSVTAPVRTIADLLRDRRYVTRDVVSCRLLLRLIPDIEALHAALASRRPHQRLARRRLRQILDGP